jgi:hypothetical protein
MYTVRNADFVEAVHVTTSMSQTYLTNRFKSVWFVLSDNYVTVPMSPTWE